jgi:hypothetical protein
MRLSDSEVARIAGGEQYVESIQAFDYDVFFDSDDMPIGIMGYSYDEYGDWLVVHSCAVDDKFTINMVKNIMKLMKSNNVCLVTDKESAHIKMMTLLSRYNYAYDIRDGMLLSYRKRG